MCVPTAIGKFLNLHQSINTENLTSLSSTICTIIQCPSLKLLEKTIGLIYILVHVLHYWVILGHVIDLSSLYEGWHTKLAHDTNGSLCLGTPTHVTPAASTHPLFNLPWVVFILFLVMPYFSILGSYFQW